MLFIEKTKDLPVLRYYYVVYEYSNIAGSGFAFAERYYPELNTVIPWAYFTYLVNFDHSKVSSYLPLDMWCLGVEFSTSGNYTSIQEENISFYPPLRIISGLALPTTLGLQIYHHCSSLSAEYFPTYKKIAETTFNNWFRDVCTFAEYLTPQYRYVQPEPKELYWPIPKNLPGGSEGQFVFQMNLRIPYGWSHRVAATISLYKAFPQFNMALCVIKQKNLKMENEAYSWADRYKYFGKNKLHLMWYNSFFNPENQDIPRLEFQDITNQELVEIQRFLAYNRDVEGLALAQTTSLRSVTKSYNLSESERKKYLLDLFYVPNSDLNFYKKERKAIEKEVV